MKNNQTQIPAAKSVFVAAPIACRPGQMPVRRYTDCRHHVRQIHNEWQARNDSPEQISVQRSGHLPVLPTALHHHEYYSRRQTARAEPANQSQPVSGCLITVPTSPVWQPGQSVPPVPVPVPPPYTYRSIDLPIATAFVSHSIGQSQMACRSLCFCMCVPGNLAQDFIRH